MKKLEEYVNENQVNEGLFDFLKNLFKAAGKSISQSIHDTYEKEYPNFMKAFDELQRADAEDKELIQKFNTMYETIDKMKDVSDNEKVFHKLNLVMAETGRFEDGDQGEGVKKLDKEKHKGYLTDLQKKLKDIETNHKEIYDKYQEAAKKGEIKKEDIIGKGDTKNEVPPTVQQAGEHEDELMKNLETLAAENEELKKELEELKKEKEKYDTKTAIERCEKFFKFIDGLEESDDGIDHKHQMKLNYVLSRLGYFAKNSNPHYDLVEDKEYYDYLTKKLNELNKENSKETKEFVDELNKGEVPEAKPAEDGDADPVKQLATEHKPTLQDISKLGGIDEKTLQGIQAKVKAFVNTSESFAEKLNNIIVEGNEDIKNKLKSDDKAQSLFSIILVAYYGLKNLKLIDNIDDLAEWLKLIESQEVKEGRISLNDYVEKF